MRKYESRVEVVEDEDSQELKTKSGYFCEREGVAISHARLVTITKDSDSLV